MSNAERLVWAVLFWGLLGLVNLAAIVFALVTGLPLWWAVVYCAVLDLIANLPYLHGVWVFREWDW